MILDNCASWNSARWYDLGTILAVYHRPRKRQIALSITKPKENQMKRSLVTVVILLAIVIGGCQTQTAPPQQGQPGPQGQTGQSGQSGQQGAQGQSGQQGQTGDPGQTGQTGQQGQQGQQGPAAPCPAGQQRYTNAKTGAVSCIATQCPAGQHRYIDPATGAASCVWD